MESQATCGWSWGQLNVNVNALEAVIDNKIGFSIPYSKIQSSSLPSKNELTIEINSSQQEEEDCTMCEVRFYVMPEAERDIASEIQQSVMEKANVGGFQGDCICSIHDLPLLVPRGKYSLNMFEDYMRFHGKSYDYKIDYKNINRNFLLPKPDGVHVAFVISLEDPIRQGKTIHPFIVLQFQKERTDKIKLDQKAQKYGLDKEIIEGHLYDVLSKLFQQLTQVHIVIPGSFSSQAGAKAMKCSVKANEGYLYPLQKSFIFIHKPVIYIRFEDVHHCEFGRVNEAQASARTFDLLVYTKKEQNPYTFTGLDRKEYKNLAEFLDSKKIKITSEQAEHQTESDEEEDEEDEESDN